jgi:prevent-host-death family protein
MGISASDVVPFTQARATLSELAEQVKAGAEKIITKNGESYVALIDAERLDYYHRLERERIHLLLIDDARRGLADIAAGRTQDADAGIAALQARRADAPTARTKGKVQDQRDRAKTWLSPSFASKGQTASWSGWRQSSPFRPKRTPRLPTTRCSASCAPPSFPISGDFPVSGGAIWTNRRSLPRL